MFSAILNKEKDYLEPYVSAETIDYHYGKHHHGYAQTLNKLVEGTKYETLDLWEIINISREEDKKIFNNSAQLFNHNFYWESLEVSDKAPSGILGEMISSQFDSLEGFLDYYIKTALELFGSGWSWLIYKDNRLQIQNTQNAEIPMGKGVVLLSTIDLWEHSFYIDYRNDKARYFKQIATNCMSWSKCSDRLNNAL